MRDYIPELIADPVSESRRYVANATALLKQHGHLDYETQLYRDRKYVRMAGNTLWNGVLLVIDSVFQVKNPSRKRPVVKVSVSPIKSSTVALSYGIRRCDKGVFPRPD